MNNLTLKQLRYVEALARHGHFGRAAEASAISQPALSVQIKELEAGLGVKLFERGSRRVTLTSFGQDFVARARDILRSVDELGDLARVSLGELTGRLRIGVIPTVAPYLVPRLIRSLTDAHPGLDVDVRETITPRLLEELAGGRLDTAIVALPVSEPSLTEVPLFDEAFVLVRPQADALAAMPAPDQLERMRLLLLEEGHCFRDQALSFCGTPSARPRHGLDGSSLATLVQMVGAGLGVTLIPEMAVPIETRSAAVAIGRFPDPQPRRQVGMIWRRTTPLAPQLHALSEVVRRGVAG
ncbi:MAG: LysR substrate-binding domain-containing protein [Jannaschia sp.]